MQQGNQWQLQKGTLQTFLKSEKDNGDKYVRSQSEHFKMD